MPTKATPMCSIFAVDSFGARDDDCIINDDRRRAAYMACHSQLLLKRTPALYIKGSTEKLSSIWSNSAESDCEKRWWGDLGYVLFTNMVKVHDVIAAQKWRAKPAQIHMERWNGCVKSSVDYCTRCPVPWLTRERKRHSAYVDSTCGGRCWCLFSQRDEN